jgi:hypothetical protein
VRADDSGKEEEVMKSVKTTWQGPHGSSGHPCFPFYGLTPANRDIASWHCSGAPTVLTPLASVALHSIIPDAEEFEEQSKS